MASTYDNNNASSRVQYLRSDSDTTDDDDDSNDADKNSGNSQDALDGPMPKGTLGRRDARRLLKPDSVRARFIRSIRRHDVLGVKKSLLANPNKKLYKTEDNYGISSLEYAVLSKSTDIVQTLLDNYRNPKEKGVAIRSAILISIRQNDIEMVEYLLAKYHEIKPHLPKNASVSLVTLDASLDSDENNPNAISLKPLPLQNGRCNDDEGDEIYAPSSHYVRPDKIFKYSISRESYNAYIQRAEDISPLVLACQLDRVEIVNLLFTKCNPDIHPLSEKCLNRCCFICSERRQFMGRRFLERSRSSIQVFKALASPAFILHSAIHDPILEVFQLSDLMRCRKTSDPSFNDAYNAIGCKAKEFAVDFLDLCRTSAEVQVLLSRSTGVEKTNSKGSKAIFPRLLVALHYGQKDFVAHPHCQQLLENAWYGGLPDWVCNPKWHNTRMGFYGLLIFLLFPILVPLYMLKLPAIDKYLKPPAQRFLTDTVSFFFFLLILLFDLIFAEPSERDELPTVLEWFIFIWALGFLARDIKMSIRRKGRWCDFSNLENTNWKFYDCALYITFLLKFLFKFIAYGIAKNEIGGHPNDRRTWNQFDPFLWSEIFYSLGCIVAITQMYSFFKASRSLGPLQITMKKMFIDVLHFLILFGICLSAFAFGITVLYRGYKGYVRVDPDNPGEEREESAAFESLRNTYKTLFWTLFNYGEPKYADIVVGNENSTDVVVKHKLTEAFGYMIYGGYNVLSVIVLLNMLIAMMAHSYESIEKNSDVEWKYARARMRIKYFNEVGCIPPPFNLVPLRQLVKIVTKYCKCKCAKKLCVC